MLVTSKYSKTCPKRPLKNGQNISLKAKGQLNAGQKYAAILLTCIKQLSVLKNDFWPSFEWPLKTVFTVFKILHVSSLSTVVTTKSDSDVTLCLQLQSETLT